MNFTVYSKEGCDYCERIKTVLRLTGCTFVVYNLGEDFTREELFEELGKPVRTIPQIVIDETHIGGFNELREYFIDKGRINFRGELLDINDFEL